MAGRQRHRALARLGVFLLVVARLGRRRSACTSSRTPTPPTAPATADVEAAGYLTLNPFKYAHPVLSIVLPLLFIVQGGIGLPGGAVYLHRHAFRSRAQQSLAALAGPPSNVVLRGRPAAVGPHPGRRRRTPASFWSGLAFLGFLQVSAAVLNLLPIPGLDG